MPTPLRSARRPLAALCLTMILSGCAPSAAPPIRPNLPDAPALFGSPVVVPDPRRGEDARLFAARTRKALLEGNQRLRDDGAFYRDVRDKFGQDQTK